MKNLRKGLSQSEVDFQLQAFGYNEFEKKSFFSFFESFVKILRDPMGLMLLVLGSVYWTLGERHDALILLLAYIPTIGVDVLLELRSQKALRLLNKKLKTFCHVIRESKIIALPVRYLVPKDFLVLEEGQIIPADGILLEAAHLTVDESSLTGESLPVEKNASQEVLSGTTVLSGGGLVEISKTGLNSQLGSIAKVLQDFEAQPSPLLQSINRIVKFAFLGALALAAIIFVEGMFKARGLAPSLLSALTLAMAAIPEEFPLVFTLYLSMAAYRLSKKAVLVKSLPSVEGLGRVDVICTDKTGTLTEGSFRLEKIWSPRHATEVSEKECRDLIFACELAAVDSMETAILEWVKEQKTVTFVEDLHRRWTLEFDNAFDFKEKYMSHIWRDQITNSQIICMKGSIEGVLKHCRVTAEDKKLILEQVDQEAKSGRRLLGLASKSAKFSGERKEDEVHLDFVALLSFGDPVRKGVKEALQLCKDKGIEIKMLTGDHLLTAHSVADLISLPHQHDQLFSGPELDLMSESERESSYQKGVIFARLSPDQKLEMIKSLKKLGKIVAMTGDGINDAPALKLADVGISMGDRATDVARSTAQMILLKNDFSGIVAAVLEGRRVLVSLRSSFGYLIAFHIPIVGLAIIQAFFLETPILLPIHIVLMELIVHPVSAFVFDESRDDTRTAQRELINWKIALWSALRGGILTGACLLIYFHFSAQPALGSSLAVLALVSGNIGLLIAESGGLFNIVLRPLSFRRIWFAVFILTVLAFSLAFVPGLSQLFSITQPHWLELVLIFIFSFLLGAIKNKSRQ